MSEEKKIHNEEDLDDIVDNLLEEEEEERWEKLKKNQYRFSYSEVKALARKKEEGTDRSMKHWPVPISKGEFNLNITETNGGKTTNAISSAIKAFVDGKRTFIILTEDAADSVAVMLESPIVEEEVNKGKLLEDYIVFQDFTRYSEEDLILLFKRVSKDYEYIILDYVEHASFKSTNASQNNNEKFTVLGGILNSNISKLLKENYFIANIQANNELSRMVRDKLKKFLESDDDSKKKKRLVINDELQEQLEYLQYLFSSNNGKTVAAGGAEMPRRAKSALVSFTYGGYKFSVCVKQKGVNNKLYEGQLFVNILDEVKKTVEFIPFDDWYDDQGGKKKLDKGKNIFEDLDI